MMKTVANPTVTAEENNKDDDHKRARTNEARREPGEEILNLLLVEDSPSDRRLFEKVLESADDAGRYWLVHVKRLSKALKFVQKERFDAIVLDLNLPDCHGVESIELIRKENASIPILVLTGLDDAATGIEAVRKGAQDYLVKGSVDGNALSECIKYAIERHKILSDLEREKDHQAYLAAHDPLTDLPNLKMLRFQLEHAIAQSERWSRTFAILFMDIDNFKNINDTYGHSAGDEVLRAFAKRLTGALRGGDIAARVGGDEFLVILNDIKRVEDVATAAQRLLKTLSGNYKIQGQQLTPTFSIGISIYPKDDRTADGLVSAADFALLQAKQMGKNRFCYFAPNMNVKAQEIKELEAQLTQALKEKQLEVHYQPEFRLDTEQVTGIQALVRWNHPHLGIVPARHFIPFIENREFVLSLNEWILENGLEQLRLWQNSGFKHLYLSVNLAPIAFKTTDFVARLSKIIKKSSIDSHHIRFEVRESDVLLDREKNLAFLKDLNSIGVNILLDGFGTGFSSMTTLERLPIKAVKIDRSVIQKACFNEDSQSVLRAIVQLAKGFGLTTIGEGVETREQFSIFRTCGGDIAQGFYLTKPVPHQLMTVILKKHASTE